MAHHHLDDAKHTYRQKAHSMVGHHSKVAHPVDKAAKVAGIGGGSRLVDDTAADYKARILSDDDRALTPKGE